MVVTEQAHDLIPTDTLETIPALYATQETKDPTVWVKLFTPDSSFTWYVTEYDPKQRLAFGLVDGHDREPGYFSIEELEGVRGWLGLRVERDLQWTPKRLSEITSEG